MSDSKTSPILSRRRVFAGAGTAGALAAAAAALPLSPVPDSKPAPVADAQDSAAGYRLTEHVRRYYRTAKV